MESKKDVMTPPEKKTRVWPYMLAGVAVGSALGMLLAPESGSETRGKIGRWLKLKEKRLEHKAGLFARSHRRHQPSDAEHPVEV